MSTETTTYTCEVCGKELPYGGRGRPPKRCDEHKKSAAKTPPSNNGSETKSEAAPRPRPRPGKTEEAPSKAETAPAPRQRPGSVSPPPVGKSDQGSRPKAEAAEKRAKQQSEMVDAEAWPRGKSGRPMAKIEMAASELVPTGQYANVSIGPARITAFVDLDRDVNGGYFTDTERETLTKALNELAEVVERDVISVQRSLVLESMQEQISQS
jgi:hypothetical protein